MKKLVLPPLLRRQAQYEDAPAVPLKRLHPDGSITSIDKSALGKEILPPSGARAGLYARAAAEPMKFLLPDGSVHDGGKMTQGNGNGGDGSLIIDNNTLRFTSGVLGVNTTTDISKDNTQPITAGGVYREIGNIQALLETI